MKRAIALLALLISLPAWGQTVPYAPITQGQVWTPTQWADAWGSKTDYPAPLTSLAAISGGTVIGNPGSTSAVPTAISGVVLGSPTGNSEGAGTLNAQGLYVQGVPVVPIPSVNVFTTTSSQTSFTLSSPSLATNATIVVLNGGVLTPGVDFTVSGTALTLTNGTLAGQTLVAIYW